MFRSRLSRTWKRILGKQPVPLSELPESDRPGRASVEPSPPNPQPRAEIERPEPTAESSRPASPNEPTNLHRHPDTAAVGHEPGKEAVHQLAVDAGRDDHEEPVRGIGRLWTQRPKSSPAVRPAHPLPVANPKQANALPLGPAKHRQIPNPVRRQKSVISNLLGRVKGRTTRLHEVFGSKQQIVWANEIGRGSTISDGKTRQQDHPSTVTGEAHTRTSLRKTYPPMSSSLFCPK